MRLNKPVSYFPVIIIAISLVLACTFFIPGKAMSPMAESGLLDLRDFDFHKYGMVSLQGTWEFYWNRFISQAEFAAGKSAGKEVVRVPGVWNESGPGGVNHPAHGFATYRLVIGLSNFRGPMALKVEDMSTAYSLWIDGKQAVTSGKVGKDFAEMTPEFLAKTVYFTPGSDSIELVFFVSNFWNNRGGLWKNVYLGTQSAILSYEKSKIGFNYFVSGILIFMFIYHFILFFLERRNWSALYFGIFCLVMALRSLITDERIIYDVIPYLGWNIALRLEYLTTYIGIPVFVTFFYSLYPAEVRKVPKRIFQITGVAWSLVALAVPPTLIAFTFDVYQYVLYAMCLFSAYALVRAIAAKRYGAVLFAIGVAILTIAIVNDILYAQFVIYTAFVSPFGLVIGIFFVEVALNVKFVRTEQAYQSALEQSRAILAASPDSMIQILKEGIINDARIKKDLAPLFTAIPEPGLHVSSVFEKELADSIIASIDSVLDSEAPSVFVHKAKSGKEALYCEVRILASEEGKILIIFRDISAKTKAEEELELQREELIHADKLVALGTLTAGVAHEINNPNNAILLASQTNEAAFSKIEPVIREAAAESGSADLGGFSALGLIESLVESFSRITRNSRRIKQIVEDLKSFAGKDSGGMEEEVPLYAVVDSSIRLLESLLKKSTTRLSLTYGKSVPSVRGNSRRLEQVVINIIQNACYALSDPGKGIEITTGYVEASGEAFIEVADEGVGMDDETMRRIFDPFFTSRRGGGGTGLGLPISARIVADHGGRIEIESEKGKGTRMRIVLPVSKARIESSSEGSEG